MMSSRSGGAGFQPDVVEARPSSSKATGGTFYHFPVDRTIEGITVTGDRKLLDALLEVVPQPA
jgi:hypothetical protein